MPGPATGHVDRSVYLVQHGEAEPETRDPDRPLTETGRKTVEQMAAWAARAGLKVDQIRHSGKLRAQQTATIFAEELQPREGLTPSPGLGPNDDVRPVAAELADSPCCVMLVGHLPFLGRLASLMLGGNPQQEFVRFRNGGLVGLVREEERWTIACVIPPELVTARE